ncbi:suppressor protein SRP40 [Impatiens glandulifera]|uniref:suppressor protein SRP40 n=1 Tax=Impatiens glandulifera TaxID=253017 RepID=UPI001FB0AF5D|nr:suppressor protein SRP40 [Impatiens glandulifera]XP_047336517.1 suppressor protein SRP40 [Impatiens glandulifera]
MIAAVENVDSKWSEKKMEESDALRTVECLRGRLIAERTVSKISKDEADQMENKLMELEKKVNEEIKSRNRVEKKLRFLMKKLEDLNISDQEGSSDNSLLSPISSSSSSSISSSSSSSNHKKLEDMIDEHKTHITESQMMTPQLSTRTSFASNKDSLDFSSPTNSMDSKVKEGRESENAQDIDDSMALVLVDLSEESSLKVDEHSSSIDYVSGNVKDVLDALKHAREKIQSSMEKNKKRIMIKVGSQLGNQC